MIGSSIPTIARSCLAMNSPGASSTDQGRAGRPRGGGQPAHQPLDPHRVVVEDERPEAWRPRSSTSARPCRCPAWWRTSSARCRHPARRRWPVVHVPAGVAPVAVGAGEVADERAQLAGVSVEQQRDDRCGQPARREADQVRRPTGLDGVVSVPRSVTSKAVGRYMERNHRARGHGSKLLYLYGKAGFGSGPGVGQRVARSASCLSHVSSSGIFRWAKVLEIFGRR